MHQPEALVAVHHLPWSCVPLRELRWDALMKTFPISPPSSPLSVAHVGAGGHASDERSLRPRQ